MVTDQQVRRLFTLMQSGHPLATAAAKAGMDERTARKYRRLGKLPSEVAAAHTWRTREDPFTEVWHQVKALLEVNPGLEAKTVFEYLQRAHPGRFADGQLRTLQRRFKQWRALEGPHKEVYFAQEYRPGERCQSDFTWMNGLGVTINGERFDHLIYHFVLPYSNWETGTICFSESFESLADGLENALFELGGVPQWHHTDSMSAAVRRLKGGKKGFTERYEALLRHYGLKALHSNASSPHELGDAEQRHHRFKRALEQALLLRGGRDFESRTAYAAFLDELFVSLNRGRRARFEEEIAALGRLPLRRFKAFRRLTVRVGAGSLIRVLGNVYSVCDRLIGEQVEVRLHATWLEVWYAQRRVHRIDRLRGKGKHRVNYRHVIDSLVRKPGAFAGYRYRSDLFPTHHFRMAYDALVRRLGGDSAAARPYLEILYLAARESEAAVDAALERLQRDGRVITADAVRELVAMGCPRPQTHRVTIDPVDLSRYDALLTAGGDGASLEVAPW